MDIISKIDKLRIERGWSVNRLAVEAGLTQSTLNNLFSRRNDPKISTLRAICEAFGITLSEFFSEENERSENDELLRRVDSLSVENKNALLVLLRNING